MIRYYVCVSGHVQGVGFRYFVKSTAHLHSITGWVRNLENGQVDMEVQGSKFNLDAFLSAVKKGNHFAEIHQIQLTPREPIEENSFKIVSA